MNNCHDKIKLKCGTKNFAPCVEYQSYVSPKTKLTQTTCLSLEDTTKDLYQLIDEIKAESDLSGITSTCLILPTIRSVKTLIQQLYDEICAIKAINTTQTSQITALQNQMAVQQARICP